VYGLRRTVTGNSNPLFHSRDLGRTQDLLWPNLQWIASSGSTTGATPEWSSMPMAINGNANVPKLKKKKNRI
jgi:hypothetical protein